MYATRQLFTAEEAFVRLGQTGETGCLFILGPEETYRIFVEKSHVVHASGQNQEGEKALHLALHLQLASHVWMPDVQAPAQRIKVNIAAYALKHSVARDIHMRDTGKVKLDIEKPQKVERPSYYLTASDRPGERFPLKNSSIVGREAGCDVVLDSLQVSRRHCLLEVTGRGLYFRDLDSTNGVTVNGIYAKEGFLNPGDDLLLGTYALHIGRGN